MKKLSTALLILLTVLIPFATRLPGRANASHQTVGKIEKVSDFEQAVRIIKKYETLHSARHWPLVGYGHKVIAGEGFKRGQQLSEKQADALLRKDLLKNCAAFREFGKDSLLLGVLAYNIGPGAAAKSVVARKLKSGDRNIKENYLAHCRYRGKVLTGLKNRRIEEFEALFVKDGEAEMVEEELIKTDSSSERNEVMASNQHKSEEDENTLWASMFSPVRLMLGAIAHPFRIASAGLAENLNINENFKFPVSNTVCVASI